MRVSFSLYTGYEIKFVCSSHISVDLHVTSPGVNVYLRLKFSQITRENYFKLVEISELINFLPEGSSTK